MLAEPAALAPLGARLRAAGLSPRALAAWAGTSRVAALPARLNAMASEPAKPRTPPAALLALLVGGDEVARGELPQAGDVLDALLGRGLIARAGDRLRAELAIVPLGPGFVVCDRLDALIDRELVCWPDDSSHHLATAIPPGRRARWLDLGCGSAFAAIARPELAHHIAGVDLNPRAVRCGQLGAALSGIAHLACTTGDIGDPPAGEPAELVTCNAPMPDPVPTPLAERGLPEIWRRADPGFFERLWPALRRAVAPGGLIVVHAATDALVPALTGAPGERAIVRYTPERARGFAVAWWRPDAADRLAIVHRALTPERPHTEPRDRDDALAAC